MANGQVLTFSPLTPQLMAELHTVLRGSFGASCWCMHPRLTNEQLHALPGGGSLSERRRVAMTSLAGRDCAPGLLAFEGAEPVGWIAVAPRSEARARRGLACHASRRRAGRLGHPLHHRPQEGPTPRHRPRPDPRRGYVCHRAWRRRRRGLPARGHRSYCRRQHLLRHRAALPSRWIPRGPRASGEPSEKRDPATGDAHRDRP